MTEDVPGAVIQIDVTVNLGGERQMALRTHVLRDLPEVEQHRLIDKVTKLAERQRCKVDCASLERDIEINERKARELRDDWQRLELSHEAEVIALKEMIGAAAGEAQSIEVDARVQWNDSGRRGEFVPGTSVKSRISNAEAIKRSKEAELQKKQAERDAAVGNYQITVKRFEDEVTKLKVELMQKRAIAGLEELDQAAE